MSQFDRQIQENKNKTGEPTTVQNISPFNLCSGMMADSEAVKEPLKKPSM